MLFPFHCPKYDTRDFFAQEKTLLPGWLLDAKLAAREPPQEVAPLLPDRQVIYETELGSAAEEARRVLGFLVKQCSAALRMRRSCLTLMLLLMMSLWMEGGRAELSSSPWHREGEGARGRGQGEARQRRRGQGKWPLISVERGEGPKHCDHHMIPKLFI